MHSVDEDGVICVNLNDYNEISDSIRFRTKIDYLTTQYHLPKEISNFSISMLFRGGQRYYISNLYLWAIPYRTEGMDLAATCIKREVTLISRLRLDAQLYQFPIHEKKKLGRKPIKGARIHLKELLNNINQKWQTGLVNWYGGEQRTIEYLTFTCLWYHAGLEPLTLSIVLVKTPGGKNVAEAFFSTDINLEPTKIITYFVLRRNIEVTFEETRARLGVETQRQWSDKIIARTTPLLMGLFSFVTLVAFTMHQTKALVSTEVASWYNKEGDLTFSDILVIVRRSIWSQKYFSKSENQPDSNKLMEKTVNTLIYQLSLAA